MLNFSEVRQVDKIIKGSMLVSFVEYLVFNALLPSIIILHGKNLDPQFLSLFLIFPTLIKCGQWIISKIDKRIAIWIPILCDGLYLFVVPLIFYNIKLFLFIEIVSGGIFTLLYYNRYLIFTNILKNYYDIQKVGNLTQTTSSVGSLCGFSLSFLLSCYLEPQIIIVTLTYVGILLSGTISIWLNIKIIEFNSTMIKEKGEIVYEGC